MINTGHKVHRNFLGLTCERVVGDPIRNNLSAGRTQKFSVLYSVLVKTRLMPSPCRRVPQMTSQNACKIQNPSASISLSHFARSQMSENWLQTCIYRSTRRVTGFSVAILPLPLDNGGTRKYLRKRRGLRTEGYTFTSLPL